MGRSYNPLIRRAEESPGGAASSSAPVVTFVTALLSPCLTTFGCDRVHARAAETRPERTACCPPKALGARGGPIAHRRHGSRNYEIASRRARSVEYDLIVARQLFEKRQYFGGVLRSVALDHLAKRSLSVDLLEKMLLACIDRQKQVPILMDRVHQNCRVTSRHAVMHAYRAGQSNGNVV